MRYILVLSSDPVIFTTAAAVCLPTLQLGLTIFGRTMIFAKNLHRSLYTISIYSLVGKIELIQGGSAPLVSFGFAVYITNYH